ncbi:MAG: serine hydrolase, partial [Oscillospiraceae bacterium]|nr:serine hydrolase [Oscillospiraceae bacterium]
MKQTTRILKRAASLLLSLLLLGSVTAFAAEGPQPGDSILDADAIQEMVDAYIQAHNYNPGNISIAYCYTATGDRWYFNENEWYYSASLYKVPLCMRYEEMEAAGQVTQETVLGGRTLAEAEYMVLVNSNNEYGHVLMDNVGGDLECRNYYLQFTDLPEEEFDPNYFNYSYFSARFMMDVMDRLYTRAEDYPHVIDLLKQAEPGNFFRYGIGDDYEIAQKYGAFTEYDGTVYNHTAGIVYTPHPFVLVVMTRNLGFSNEIIGNFAKMFEEYTLTVDEQYDQHQKELEEARKAEEARVAEEERLRKEAEEQAQASETEPMAETASAAAP